MMICSFQNGELLFCCFFSLSAFCLVCPPFHHSYCLEQMVIPSLDTATGRIVAQDLCYFIKNQERTALSLFAHRQLNKCGSKGTVFAWYRFFSLVQELGNYQSWFLILSHHPESLHRLFSVQWQTGYCVTRLNLKCMRKMPSATYLHQSACREIFGSILVKCYCSVIPNRDFFTKCCSSFSPLLYLHRTYSRLH